MEVWANSHLSLRDMCATLCVRGGRAIVLEEKIILFGVLSLRSFSFSSLKCNKKNLYYLT